MSPRRQKLPTPSPIHRWTTPTHTVLLQPLQLRPGQPTTSLPRWLPLHPLLTLPTIPRRHRSTTHRLIKPPTTNTMIGNIPLPTFVQPSTPSSNPSFGDSLRPTTHSRILFNNINGLRPDNAQFGKVHELAQWCTDNDVTFIGLAETKLKWNYKRSYFRVSNIFRRYFPDSRLSKSSVPSNTPGHYQAGGTCLLASEKSPRGTRNHIHIRITISILPQSMPSTHGFLSAYQAKNKAL